MLKRVQQDDQRAKTKQSIPTWFLKPKTLSGNETLTKQIKYCTVIKVTN